MEYENLKLKRFVHPEILEVGGTHERQQLQAVFYLACRCISHNAEDRPTSTEVAKELRRIQRGLSKNNYESNEQFLEKVGNIIGFNGTLSATYMMISSYIHATSCNNDGSCASLSSSSLPSPSSPPDYRAQTGDQHTVANEGPSQRTLEVAETYKTDAHVHPIFAFVGAEAKQFFTAPEATDIALKYIEKQKLVKPTDESIVV